jgi:cytoskeleton protein RodZ
MTPIGETLRRERLRKNLDLNQVSSQLKIAPRFLEAIEEEQFDRLPGTVFAKAFVRQYARVLGLEEEELAGQVKQLLEPPAPEPPFPQTQQENGTIHLAPLEEWESAGAEHEFKWPSWIPATGLVIVAMLGCSFVYAWWQRDRHTVSAQTANVVSKATVQSAPVSPPPGSAATPPAAGEPQTPAAADGTVPATSEKPQAGKPEPAVPGTSPPNGQVSAPPTAEPTAATVPQTADAKPETPAPAINPNASVHVEVSADEDVWVSARADGKYLFSRTLGAHESRKLDGADTITLRLGNAGGVNIKLNGRPIGPIGGKGQTRTLQFTSGGFQIVEAPKSSLPPL